MLFTNGVRFTDLAEPSQKLDFQTSLLRVQMSLEDSFEALARSTKEPSVLLCDRGACDGKAYIDQTEWLEILARHGMDNDISVREGRYNAVFHLVTAANGAQTFYTLANNVARSEDAETACEIDAKLQRAWTGHPKHIVFDNSSDFEGKMQRVVDEMARIVGLPLVQRTPNKFLLINTGESSDAPFDLEHMLRDKLGTDAIQVFEVEKIYVVHGNPARQSPRQPGFLQKAHGGVVLQYSFIRRRTQDGFSVYGHTQVRRHPNGDRVEIKRIISVREYEWMKSMYADPARHVVLQKRFFFIWEGKTFSIHQYQRPREDVAILHCQAAQGDADESSISFPPFLRVGRSLDEDGEYSAYRISLRERLSIGMPPRANSVPVASLATSPQTPGS